MHNYNDIERDLGSGCAVPAGEQGSDVTRTAWVTYLLEVLGWRGWPYSDPLQVRMFLTEGGAVLSRVADIWNLDLNTQRQAVLDRQAWLLQRNWNRMKTNTVTDGKGVSMVTQYPMFGDSQPQHDSGLLEDQPGLAPRPSYFTWRAFQSSGQ